MGSSIEESETITDKGMRFFSIPSALPVHEAHQVSHPMGAGNLFSEGKASRAWSFLHCSICSRVKNARINTSTSQLNHGRVHTEANGNKTTFLVQDSKIKITSLSTHGRYKRKSGGTAPLILDLGAKLECSTSALVALTPEINPGTHCIGGWVKCRVRLHVLEYKLHLLTAGTRTEECPSHKQSLYNLSFRGSPDKIYCITINENFFCFQRLNP
jgi:hypothetical protein